MARKLSPQGYVITQAPTNENPLWTEMYGIPSGGLAGQVLAKASEDDYDVHWIDVTSGEGGVTIEQVRAITDPLTDRVSILEEEYVELAGTTIPALDARLQALEDSPPSGVTLEQVEELIDSTLVPINESIETLGQKDFQQDTLINTNRDNITSLDQRVTNINSYAENIYNELDGRTTILEARAEEGTNQLQAVVTRVTQNEQALSTLDEDLSRVETSLNGGTTGQVLAKASNTDRAFVWVDPAQGGGVTLEQVQAITDPLEAAVTENTDDIEALTTRVSNAEASVVNVQDRLVTAESNIIGNAGSISALQTKTSELETEVSTNASEIVATNEAVSNLGTSLSSTQSDLSSVTADFNAVNEAINGAGAAGTVLTRTGTGNNAYQWVAPSSGGVSASKITRVDLFAFTITGVNLTTGIPETLFDYVTGTARQIPIGSVGYGGLTTGTSINGSTTTLPNYQVGSAFGYSALSLTMRFRIYWGSNGSNLSNTFYNNRYITALPLDVAQNDGQTAFLPCGNFGFMLYRVNQTTFSLALINMELDS